MSLIRLKPHPDDDSALLFRLRHIIAGAVRYARAKHAHIVKIDNWFGSRWRCFAGSPNGKDLHPENRLAIPPFAPKRVVAEASYRRSGDELMRIAARRLHETKIVPSAAMPFYLDDRFPSGVFIWYSGNTANQDRGSLMVYEVQKDADQRAWYAELQKRDGVWSVSSAIGTSVNEIAELETAYGNRLAPLFRAAGDQEKFKDRALWQRALDATYGSDVATTTVLIEKYRARHPENSGIRLLHAMNLGDRRQFRAAEEAFREIERLDTSENWRRVWLREWASFNSRRRDEVLAEEAYREYTTLEPNHTAPWIFLGVCLARQGKLEEAESVHRHATTLEGDPDEAYLNLGFVLRARGRLEDAASAFEAALSLCPDYPEASAALSDVRAALELRDDSET